MDDLFSAAADTAAANTEGSSSFGLGARNRAPLAVRMRPRKLDEVLGQDHLLGAGSPLRRLAGQAGAPSGASGAGPSSVILWGPPGTGKTTLAHAIARGAGASGERNSFVELSAVTAGVKDVRKVMDEALTARDLYGRTTVLFLDEIHRFSKAQQDALLPGVENRWVVLIAATTENPSFSVVAPLLSRSLLLTLRPLQDADIRTLLERAIVDPRGLGGRVGIDLDTLEHLVRLAAGDARRALTTLEAAAGVALERQQTQQAATPAENEGVAVKKTEAETAEFTAPKITLADAEKAIDTAAVRYDRAGDQHYDVISAFIKSIRGSDVDAALHYLARMVEAGEDPRFIARRLIISASEDIGMADPTALHTAVAAAQAVALIGMPEGRIILAEAVVHLATAPKSNAAYRGIDAAIADIRAGKGTTVPSALRDSHYSGAQQLGHGRGYRYAHDWPHGVVEQQYPPEDLIGVDYYHPSSNGSEREISARLQRLRGIIRGTGEASAAKEANKKPDEDASEN